MFIEETVVLLGTPDPETACPTLILSTSSKTTEVLLTAPLTVLTIVTSKSVIKGCLAITNWLVLKVTLKSISTLVDSDLSTSLPVVFPPYSALVWVYDVFLGLDIDTLEGKVL